MLRVILIQFFCSFYCKQVFIEYLKSFCYKFFFIQKVDTISFWTLQKTCDFIVNIIYNLIEKTKDL